MIQNHIFEIEDKSGRKIHLSKERWTHIRKKHPEVEDTEIIKQTLSNPDKLMSNHYDETVNRYYKYFKDRKPPRKYLFILVKYLNGKGYVITTYFNDQIK